MNDRDLLARRIHNTGCHDNHDGSCWGPTPADYAAADTQLNNKLLTINGEDNTHE